MNPSGKSAGGGKGGRKTAGGGEDLIKSTYALTTTRQHLLTLRYALQCDDGRDKDVTEPFTAFKSFDRNGLSLCVDFVPGKLLTKAQLKFAKSQFEAHAEVLRDCGLSIEDKINDLKDGASRLLFVKTKPSVEDTPAQFVAFVHARFTLQGELQELMEGEPVLLVADCFLEPSAQRKGLGRHLFALLELVALKEKMTGIMIAAYPQTITAVAPFALTRLKGYVQDSTWAPADESVVLFCKSFTSPPARPAAAENMTPNVAAPPQPVKFEPVAEATAVAVQQAMTGMAVADEDEEDDEEEDEDEEEDAEATAERVMDELCVLFEERNGRPPTEEEIASWRETLASAGEA